MYSASLSIVLTCLLYTPLGPDHPGCASGNALTDHCACVSTLVEHRSLSIVTTENDYQRRTLQQIERAHHEAENPWQLQPLTAKTKEEIPDQTCATVEDYMKYVTWFIWEQVFDP